MPRRSQLRRTRSKKSVPELVRTVHHLLPPDQVEFWGMDEHRIGLKPILRRVWAQRGQRPTVVVHPRYQWSYVYGFVHPRSGRTFFLILPTVSLTAFEVALREFARFLGAGPNKHVFLVLDRAGWHTSRQLLLPTPVASRPPPVFLATLFAGTATCRTPLALDQPAPRQSLFRLAG